MKFIFLLVISFISSLSFAQKPASYSDDLYSLRSILETMPSYKGQLKGDTLVAYDRLFQKLLADSNYSTSDYQYFYNLAQLFFPIRDNHRGFYQMVNNDNFKDRASYEQYIQTKQFREFPKYNINLDSLKKSLGKKPLDSPEGIYYLDTMLTVGIFKVKQREYVGVVLQSAFKFWDNPIWQKGEVALHLYEYLPNHFSAIYARPLTKTWILYPNEKYRDFSLINSHFYETLYEANYTKLKNHKDYSNLPKSVAEFDYKLIDSSIQYIQIKHFSANVDAMKRSLAFYDSIKRRLTAPYLILDLRNNEGGAEKASRKFLRLLEDYVKKGQLYVLVNNATFSQGEIFTLQLKRLSNVKVLGQTTNGTMVYGSNYGKRERLSSQAFEVYVTDMDPDPRLIPYEVFGVQPDIILNNKKDWIEQVVELIRKSKSK